MTKSCLSYDLSQECLATLTLMKKQQDQYEKDRLILSRIESTTTNTLGALHKLSDVLVNRKITVQARSY